MRRAVLIGVAVIVAAIALFAMTKTRPSSTSAKTESSQTLSSSKRGAHAITVDAPARRVAGTVFLDDAVAPNATVRLIAMKSGAERIAQTDAKGQFALDAVASGRYSVVAEVPRATGAALALDLTDPLVDSETLRLVAHACVASIHGVVRDISGGTIARARIVVANRLATGPGVEAGDDGSYELCVPVGEASVIVRADGYADAFAPVNVYGRVGRDFALAPEAVVAGRAVRADDGSPVAGAEITLSTEDFRASRGRLPFVSTVSESDGAFRFRGIAPGTYALSATAPQLATRDSIQIVAEVASPVEDVEAVLAPALTISGRTVDKQKKPVANANVVLRNEDELASFRTAYRNARSRPDGSFVFENLTPGDYQVGTFSEGPRSNGTAVKLDNQDVTDVAIEVEVLGSVSGRVTRAGKAVEGAEVSLRSPQRNFFGGPTAVTDADGQFELQGVRPGGYQVYAESKRLGAFTEGAPLAVREGEAVKGVQVELDLAGSIAGVVVDQTGAPVAGVHVRFVLGDGRDYGEATTADDGTFKAGAMSGGGDYAYQVRPSSDSSVTFRPAPGTKFTPINVKDGNSAVAGVQIMILHERLSITGRVLAANGAPVPDIPVSAERRGGRGWAPPMTMTDENGAFVIKDLTAGKYVVSARSPKGAAALNGIDAGAKNVELQLPMLGEIKGTLEGFSRAPTIVAYSRDGDMMMMHQLRGVVTGSSFVIKNTPVGTYVVRATSSDGFAQESVTVEAKTPATLVLKNPGVGTVEGTVVDETTKEPIADAYCRASTNGMARSDKSGTFRISRAVAGPADVRCGTQDYEARTSTTIEVGKTTRVELVAKKRGAPQQAYSGLTLDVQGEDVLVKAVAGPAERAAIKVGDKLVAVRSRDINPMFGVKNLMRMIEMGTPGMTVKLTLERDDKERGVDLTLEARP